MQIPQLIKTRAFFFSVVLHVLIVVFLIVGIEPSVKLAPAPPNKPLMEAKAVNLAAMEAEKKRKADIIAAKKKAELEEKQAEKARRETAEKEKQQRLEREQAQKKAQEKKALEEALAKREAEKKKERELKEKQEAEAKAAKKKAAEEKAKKEALEKEQREKAEKEKARKEKERQEQEKRDREKAKEEAEEKARQKALADELAEEERELAEAQQRAAEQSELAKYTLRITTSVSRAFSYPPGLEDGLNCTLYVRMIPGGEVIEARVIKSSGSPTFDRQAENAVRKASPLPVPSEPKLFERMREIQFTFDPNN